MASPADPYAALSRITDPHLRASLKLILDQVGDLRRQSEGIGGVSRPLGAPLDASGHLLSQIADAVNPKDAVNLQTLRQYITAAVSGALDPVARPAPTPSPPSPANPPQPPAPPPPGPIPPGPGPGPSPPPNPEPPPSPPGAPPQPGSGNIRIAGKFLRRPDGGVYRWRGCSDFLLYKRFLDGEAIGPITADRTGEGATLVRVFGIWPNPPIFNPTAYPNYLTQLPVFASALAGAGLDLEFTVFAGAQDFSAFNTVDQQRDWLQSVRNALLASPNVVIELVNEGFKNGVDFRNHTRPDGIVSAADAQASPDANPANPPWDYSTLHTPRDNEWPRKAKDTMEVADQFGRPAVADEPIGADEVNIPGSRSNVPNDFYYYGAVGMLLGLTGGTFHSTDGITSSIFRPTTRACAAAFYAGINVIPESVLGGRYTRTTLSDAPMQGDGNESLRTFFRYTANEACAVAVRPAGAWPTPTQNGWTITGSAGPGGCVVFLSK